MANILEVLARIRDLDRKRKAIQAEIDECKDRIKRFMFKTGRERIESDYGTVYTINTDKIIYDVRALHKKVDPDLLCQFIDRRAEIVDLKAFKKLMSKYDISSGQLKGIVEIKKTVNEKKLQRLLDIGEIDLEDLEGCYETEKGKESIGFRLKE
jgi:hypothetical protein